MPGAEEHSALLQGRAADMVPVTSADVGGQGSTSLAQGHMDHMLMRMHQKATWKGFAVSLPPVAPSLWWLGQMGKAQPKVVPPGTRL